MSAASFGLILSNISATNAYAVLTNGQIVVIQGTGGPSLTASFYAGDGTLLSGPVTLNPGASPSFDAAAPRVAALPNGGFAVLGETSSGNTGDSDSIATFDAQGNQVDAWTPINSQVDGGASTLLDLAGGGFFAAWNTDAHASTNFNPLLQGSVDQGSNPNTNQAAEGTDVQGESFSASGALANADSYNSGTLTDLTAGLPYNGLAGNQFIGQAAQLAGGAIVQTYLDESYYLSSNKFGAVLDTYPAVSFSINGGRRTLVYTQGDIGNPTGFPTTTGLPIDTYSGAEAVALSNGTFAVFYTLVDDSNIAAAGRVHTTYAAFYNADGTQAGAPVAVLQRSAYNIGNDNYPGGAPSVVSLPSGGFAMSYYAEPTAGSSTLVLQVGLFDATGHQTQSIAVPFSSNTPSSALAVAADGTLYVEDDLNNVYAIVGTDPSDVAINASADTSPETLSATSTTSNYIQAGSGATTILGGTGADTLRGGTGGDVFELGASTAVVTSIGADTVVGSTGRATINATGHLLYFGSVGPTVINPMRAAATLVGGGAETVNAASASALVFGGTGAVDFNAGSGASTVVGGAGANTLTGGSAPTLYFGNGSSLYIPGTAVDTVVGFDGSLTATGGANGTLFFTGTAGGSDVSSGAGSSTIIGFGAGDSLSATGSDADVIEAAAASETINAMASSGTNTFFAFGQNDVVQAGAGSTAIQSYVGSQTLAAGTGSDLFAVVASGQRAVTFANFTPGQDFVQLQGYTSGTATASLQNATQSGGNEVVTLPDGSTLTFVGVTGVSAGSFIGS